MKSIAELPFTPDHIASYLMDYKRRPEWNSRIKSIEEVARFSDNFLVLQHELQLQWPLDNRVNVYVYQRVDEAEDVYVVGKSIDIGLQPRRGITIADLIVFGFKIEPLGEGCRVSFVICNDLKGNFSTAVMNKVAKKQSETINSVRKALSK